MPPVQRKTYHTVIMETVLFICIFAVLGHLTVNIWERYVIQTELVRVKSSLHTLKDTIYTIENAYDHLHSEMVQLVEIAQDKLKNPFSSVQKLDKSVIDKRTLHDLQIQADIKKKGFDRQTFAEPYTVNVTTDNRDIVNRNGKVAQARHFADSQHNVLVAVPSKRNQDINVESYVKIKDVGTITRNPLISTAVGKSEIKKENHKMRNSHKNRQYNDKSSNMPLRNHFTHNWPV